MIDFRYHLVSIIAVFLALAIGLAVGSTALSGKAVEFLNSRERAAVATNSELTKRNQAQTNQLAADQAFAQAAAGRLLGGLLAHEKVVIVVAPGADNSVTNGVDAAVREAGATVTGEVQLSQSFLTTTGYNETSLTQLAQNLAAKVGLSPPTQSQSQIAGQQAVAQLLAASLLDSPSGTSALSGKATEDVLTGIEQNGFISAPPTLAAANLAVLIAPGGAPQQTGSDVLTAVATELKQAGSGVVVAGGAESVGQDSVISAVDSSADPVSTVDNADTEIGQIMVAQALRYLLEGKAPGQYGIGPGTAPNPAPTPSPTPSSTVTAGGHP